MFQKRGMNLLNNLRGHIRRIHQDSRPTFSILACLEQTFFWSELGQSALDGSDQASARIDKMLMQIPCGLGIDPMGCQ